MSAPIFFFALSTLAQAALLIVAVVAVLVVGLLAMVAQFYRKVDQGKALIVNTMKAEPTVTFTGATVLPIIHRAEIMDISVKTIEVDRRGEDGLICEDNIRADIKVTFFVRVNKTGEDVLKVAQSIGCQRASDHATLETLFAAKFSEALKTVGKRLQFEELYTKRDEFRDDIISVIGKDLNGYVLEDAAIDYLEQTPLNRLDPSNILDAQGIRKITEMTAAQNVQTNELKQKERMDIGQQDLTADEAVFRYDQQRAEAEARKAREIDVAQTREQNEASRYKISESKETELARQVAQEEVKKREQEMQRNIDVATKQRERIVVMETVEVQKAEDLKQIEREREVELMRIAKEKELEREKKEIADVVRARIAVDKTVAEEEERIKDLRLVADATRHKDAKVVTAEGDAQAELVKAIKAAEASQQVAKHQAQERIIGAEAELEAADALAKGKIRLAEGVQAEVAAQGLAEVKVKEANAMAIEKQGMAEAKVTRETMSAEAEGTEAKGMARIRVDEAEAQTIERRGVAEADAIEKRLVAEASGLREKAKAMLELDGAGREHEEYRIRLEQQKEIALAQLLTQERMAEHQAAVMGKAFEEAKIQIVGGDGQFFDKFVKAMSVSNAMDNVMETSPTAQKVLGGYLDGDSNLRDDVKGLLAGASENSETLKNLSVTALLAKLASKSGEVDSAKLAALMEKAKELGID